MIEQFQILDHRIRVEYRINWCINFVFEREDIPADFAMGVLEHACVESAKDVRGVILCIRGADGRFECRGQVMSIEGVCGTSEAWSVGTVKDCKPSVAQGQLALEPP